MVQQAAFEPHRFTVDEYYRMAAAGILGEDDRVELLDGVIVEMPPIGSRHAWCVNRLNRLLQRSVDERTFVSVQNPVRLDDRSEPEPNLAVLRPRGDDRQAQHPTPSDVLLIVEVADSSVGYDRSEKGPIYATAGIAEYWLVDLNAERIEVYREPADELYRSVQVFRRGERVSVDALPGLEFTVDEILGPPDAG